MVTRFIPEFPISINNPFTKIAKPNSNFDEIQTKQQGIIACEQNSAYGKTIGNTEQKQMALAMADYCYAVIAGKFNDVSLCKRALDKNNCKKTANELIDMGKEIQNMSPEEKQQMQNVFKNMYKP